jgi:hypothetical protein
MDGGVFQRPVEPEGSSDATIILILGCYLY